MVKQLLKVLLILVLKLFFHFFKKLNPVIMYGASHDGLDSIFDQGLLFFSSDNSSLEVDCLTIFLQRNFIAILTLDSSDNIVIIIIVSGSF
jgi:hypothetical protein